MSLKRVLMVTSLTVAAALLAVGPVAAQSPSAAPTAPAGTGITTPGTGLGNGYGRLAARGAYHAGETALIQAANLANLSEAEKATLLYMREEEKLAHDVYTALAAKWDVQVFANIARSEQQHADTVLRVIQAAGLQDPAAGLEAGKFSDPQLQALYDKLVAQGSQSLAEAYQAGAAIEETDILDLEKAIDETSNTVLQRVYENLKRGSSSHLRAFVRNWEQETGETYTPQFLTAEQYEALPASRSLMAERGRPNAALCDQNGYSAMHSGRHGR